MTHADPWYSQPGVVERFRELWDAGISTSEIGRLLGASKNAIVGKSRRLGFVARPSPIGRQLPPGEAARRAELRRINRTRGDCTTLPPLESLARKAPPAPPPKAPPPVVPKIERKPETRRTCLFLSGEKPFIKCDQPAEGGYVYCRFHCKAAYLDWPKKRMVEVWG